MSREPLCRSVSGTGLGLAACVTVLALGGGLAAQLGGDLIGYSAAQIGRGGADVAIAEEVSALLTNPAGLLQIRDAWRGQTSLRLFRTSYRYQDGFNPGGVAARELSLAPYLGLAWNPAPGREGRPGDLRLAAGIYHLGGHFQDITLVTQDQPEGVARRTELLITGLHAGGAVQISERLSFGVSASLTRHELDVFEPIEMGVDTFQGVPFPGSPQTWAQLLSGPPYFLSKVRIAGDLDADPAWGLGFTLGVLWRPLDGLRLGLAWRSPTWLPDHAARARVDLGLIFDQPDPITFPDGFVAHYRGRLRSLGTPQSLVAGAAWQATSDLLLTVEGRWTQWSRTHRSLDLSLEGGDNAGVNAFMGSDRLMIHVPLAWRDQWSVSAGAELMLGAGWILRAGGTAASDPVPPGGASPGSPAFARWHLGLGVGWRSPDITVDLGWLHTFRATVTAATSLVSSDLDGSTQSIATDSLMLSISFRF